MFAVDGTFKGNYQISSSHQITIKNIGYDIQELIGQHLPDDLNPVSLLNFYLSQKIVTMFMHLVI